MIAVYVEVPLSSFITLVACLVRAGPRCSSVFGEGFCSFLTLLVSLWTLRPLAQPHSS